MKILQRTFPYRCQVAEYAMIARDVMIAYATKAHVHIRNLRNSVKVVEFAQGLGANVTAEVAPQHLRLKRFS